MNSEESETRLGASSSAPSFTGRFLWKIRLRVVMDDVCVSVCVWGDGGDGGVLPYHSDILELDLLEREREDVS